MKTMMIIFLMIVLLLVGCSKEVVDDVEEPVDESEELIGGDCGTVTPGHNDECCEMQNVDTVHAQCVGEWKYNFDTAECEWVCDVHVPQMSDAEVEARELAEAHVMEMDEYANLNGRDLEILSSMQGRCDGCWVVDIAFDMDLGSSKVTVMIIDEEVSTALYSQS